MIYTVGIKDVTDPNIQRLLCPTIRPGTPVWQDHDDAVQRAYECHHNDPQDRIFEVYGVEAEWADTAIDTVNNWSVVTAEARIYDLSLKNFTIINTTDRYVQFKSGSIKYLYKRTGSVIAKGFVLMYDGDKAEVYAEEKFLKKFKGTVTNTLYGWHVANCPIISKDILFFRQINISFK